VQDARDFHAAPQVGLLGLERQRRPPLRHQFDVAADAERAACSFKQHGADLVILRRPPRRLYQPPRHIRIERIASVRAVHGDGEQAVIEVLQDDFVVHGVVLSFCAVIPGWSEGPDPESRDSGFDASHRPGMTTWVYFFTSGQREASSGWNASLPGMV